jgi:hypothetical protein
MLTDVDIINLHNSNYLYGTMEMFALQFKPL